MVNNKILNNKDLSFKESVARCNLLPSLDFLKYWGYYSPQIALCCQLKLSKNFDMLLVKISKSLNIPATASIKITK